MTAGQAEAAARLLERLLSDPGYRTQFRRNPVIASRAAGLDELADELAVGGARPFQTLDDRESRSGLAGVFIAAALEGAAIFELSREILPDIGDLPPAVGDVLSHLHLPAVAEARAATYDRHAAGQFRAVAAADPPHGGGSGHGLAAALLNDHQVTLDASGLADFRGGHMDSRLVSVLESIARDHRITVSATKSDHPKFTTGGSISNHFYGRAVDIATIDGRPVGPGNETARRIALALSKLPASIRPTEIGSPWALPGAAYFTDAAHQNHLHVGFDDPVPAGWKPPEQVAADSVATDDDSGDVPDSDTPNDDPPLPADDDEQPLRSALGPDEGPSPEDSDDEDDEPGGLEDPGGDTDAEADDESDSDEDGESGDDEGSGDDEDEDEDEDDEPEEDDSTDGDDGSDGDDADSGSDGDDSDSDSDAPDADADVPDEPDLDAAPGDYPGDDAGRSDLAAWMAAAAKRRGLPPELPVMAALVESGLANLDHGDADSVGFFQMRTSIWDNADYAGYPDEPQLQLDWFLDHAEAVKQQRLAAGLAVDDPSAYGEWIADVERPAAQYRGRYQLRLAEARGLLKG